MSQLDIILQKLELTFVALNAGITKKEAKQQIKTLMLEIIFQTDFAYKDASAYAEVLRKKVEEL